MTEEFRIVTQLIALAARGQLPDEKLRGECLKHGEDSLMMNAILQHCELLLILALQDIYIGRSTKMANNSFNVIKRQILINVRQGQALSALLEAFKAENIECSLLKGRALAALYALPESRSSCDTDLLISRDDEQRAYEICRILRYDVTPRNYFSHHGTCSSPDTGDIELHCDLFFDLVEKTLFSDGDISSYMTDEPLYVRIGDTDCKTLGVTDHLIFITLHMIHHFIRGGTSLRQLCDILLYLRKYKTDIDMQRYLGLLDKLGYRGIYNAVCGCGVRYYFFTSDELPKYEDPGDAIAEAFMTDIEEGGWIGKSREDDDGTVFRYYGSLRRASDSDDYEKYLLKYQLKRAFLSLFPSRERMAARIPAAKKTYLLPYAWVCWLSYGMKVRSEGKLSSKVKSASMLTEAQSRRIELFQSLGMITPE